MTKKHSFRVSSLLALGSVVFCALTPGCGPSAPAPTKAQEAEWRQKPAHPPAGYGGQDLPKVSTTPPAGK